MTTEPAFDAVALCDAYDNDLEMIQELVVLVVRDLPKYRQTLEAAAQAGDLIGLSRAAHAIKGAVGNVYAGPLCQTAHELEVAGRAEDGTRVAALMPDFRVVVATLLTELAAWSERSAVAAGTSRS